MRYYVYILHSSKDGNLYIGVTNNLARRVEEHNRGNNRSTRYRRPLELIYSEMFLDKGAAYRREWHFKHMGVGNKEMRKLAGVA
ncbi:GIY-YIG nuclease family protein [Patescibacteria group bacterium]|nr:GIY-YIG nuclease family protein [Patescibacteria group bacterium]MBU1868724.1 GIY-YIG nuclease family protein [Patescibacteria group bacterium]